MWSTSGSICKGPHGEHVTWRRGVPKVAHFRMPADDPKNAVEVCWSVFGLNLRKYGKMDY
jgi:predicted enzyme related to lactoylglutathione lyase